MPALTRRRYPERDDCWHVYYDDTCVGTIARRAGVPVDVDQWSWVCGFYPASHNGIREDGTAATFELARDDFEKAWRRILPRCTDADFVETDGSAPSSPGNTKCGTPATGCRPR